MLACLKMRKRKSERPYKNYSQQILSKNSRKGSSQIISYRDILHFKTDEKFQPFMTSTWLVHFLESLQRIHVKSAYMKKDVFLDYNHGVGTIQKFRLGYSKYHPLFVADPKLSLYYDGLLCILVRQIQWLEVHMN